MDDFESAVTSNNELWPWQSKLVKQPSFEDGLYNDYRVIHFHLGIGFDTYDFINRTNELLFALVDSKTVYEIGVFKHKCWYDPDILNAIDDNWPSLLDPVTIDASSVHSCPQKKQEIKTHRDAGINFVVKLKSGRYVQSLGGGITMNGTSIEAVRTAIHISKIIKKGEKFIVSDITEKIQKGTMKNEKYNVILCISDNEIAAVIGNTYKWSLWKKT